MEILERGGSALDAAEAAAIVLEDNPLFNAGTGSTLNSLGKVEMDAAIMDGPSLRAGAVAAVSGIKIRLASPGALWKTEDSCCLRVVARFCSRGR